MTYIFDRLPGTGILDSWAEAWRRRQGIDQWPVIEASVIGVKLIPGDEGADQYRVTLRYYPPNDPGTSWDKVLTVTKGTTLASVTVGDKIVIHCHPVNPDRIAQRDTTQLAHDLGTWLFMGVFTLVFLYLLLTHHLHWSGSDD